MNTKKTISGISRKIIFLISIFAFLAAFSLVFQESAYPAKADSDGEKIEKKEGELETLEQKARNYQRMIDLKRQQQMTLQNQLKMMDVQIDNFENEVSTNQNEIAEYCEENGEWHTLEFYDSEMQGNLIEQLYALGFFRFFIRRVNNYKQLGDGDPSYLVTIEGTEKNLPSILNLIADLRAKYEERITIKIEKR